MRFDLNSPSRVLRFMIMTELRKSIDYQTARTLSPTVSNFDITRRFLDTRLQHNLRDGLAKIVAPKNFSSVVNESSSQIME